jgi:hypothetical protein
MFIPYNSKKTVRDLLHINLSNQMSYGTQLQVCLMSGSIPDSVDVLLEETDAQSTFAYHGKFLFEVLESLGHTLVASQTFSNVLLPSDSGSVDEYLDINNELEVYDAVTPPSWFIIVHSYRSDVKYNGLNFYRMGVFGTLGIYGGEEDLQLPTLSPLPRFISLNKIKFDIM